MTTHNWHILYFFCSDIFHNKSGGGVKFKAQHHLKHKCPKWRLTEVKMKHKLLIRFLGSPTGIRRELPHLDLCRGVSPPATSRSRYKTSPTVSNGDIKWHKSLEELETERNLTTNHSVFSRFGFFLSVLNFINISISDINNLPSKFTCLFS